MKRTLLIVAVSLLFIVSPVSAQQTPTPSPGSTLINDFNSLKDSLGIVGALLAIFIVIILVILYLGARYYVSPMATSQTSKDQAIITMATQVSNAGAQTATSLGQSAQLHADTAGVMKGLLTQMSELETRTEAVKRQEQIQANSNAARDAINEHTDTKLVEVAAPLNEGIGEIKGSLTTIIERMDKLPTGEQMGEIKHELTQVRDRIGDLEQAVKSLIETDLTPKQLPSDSPPVIPTPPTTE